MMKRQNSRLETFLSLDWYEVALRFLFTFVAKTSEVLLAAGLVVSTANFLTDGSILATHPDVSIAWAWAQALAIDSSLGVSLSYAWQCIKQEEWIRGVLYGVLTLLLALVAGAITTIDIVSHALHLSTGDAMVQIGINIAILSRLRAIAVIGFILMSRLRDLPLATLLPKTEARSLPSVAPAGGPSQEARVQTAIQSLCSQFSNKEMAQILNACILAKKLVFARVVPKDVPEPPQPLMDQQRQIHQSEQASEPSGTGAILGESGLSAVPPAQLVPELDFAMEPSRKAPVATGPHAPVGHDLQSGSEPRFQVLQAPELVAGAPATEQVMDLEMAREPLDRTLEQSAPDAAPLQERLELAYQSLLAEGKKPSGRALAERAHVHRSTCVEWLRTHHQEGPPQEDALPEEPLPEQIQERQLSEPVEHHQEPEWEQPTL